MKSRAKTARNPGPGWGYPFLRLADRVLPEAIYRPLRLCGTWIAWACMREQRRHSREYLNVLMGRPPAWHEVFRHFAAFEEMLMAKLRVANGREYRTEYGPDCDDFRTWLERGDPVLLGTFHIGVSDLLGCQIAGYPQREIYVLRQRVGNSHDIDRLAAQFAGRLHFVWVNEPGEMIFRLKEAAATRAAIALQCDRADFAARTEAFEFLGARRIFPFTIYELAQIFNRPVLMSVGMPRGPATAVLHASPRYDPMLPGESRSGSRARAREHFQSFLHRVEVLLQRDPYQWFNFTRLNPPSRPIR